MDVSLSELWKLVMEREAWRAAVHEVTKSRTQLSNWIELNWVVTLLPSYDLYINGGLEEVVFLVEYPLRNFRLSAVLAHIN